MSARPTGHGFMEVFQATLQTLESAGLDYMVVGSIASIVYGEPRMTKDMDLVVDISPADVMKFEFLFPEERFYVPPAETLRDEVARRGQFNLIHPESGLKIDFMIRKGGEHGVVEFKRRRRLPLFAGFEAWIASPEDVVIKKLEYFREGGSEKHLVDIRGILTQTNLDQDYLQGWVRKLGLAEQFARI